MAPNPARPAGSTPAGLSPRLCRDRIKQSATTGQGPDAPTTKYAHNALGQRVFKTEPLFSTAATPGTGKNLNNLLADDGEKEEGEQEPPGLIQQILNFWSKLWSPSTSDAEKLGWSYVYAEDGSLLGEYGSGGSASSGTSQYLYLPTASGPMPIAAVIKGQTYAIHSDHLNTPRKLTQADGQAAWQWAYSAFGEEQPTTGAKRFTNETTTPTTGATSIPEVTFNLRYPGQYFDQETKLHYNWNRTYDSRTGRYTQGDPIGLDGGWNRFSYVNADPLSRIDPLGLADLNLFSPNDKVPYSGANNWNPPGYFSVTGHGNGSVITNLQPKNRIIYNPEELANVIRLHPHWNRQPVILGACDTGGKFDYNDNTPFAQRLANSLGVSVTAPNSLVWYDMNGMLGVGSRPPLLPFLDSTFGDWKIFKPAIQKQ